MKRRWIVMLLVGALLLTGCAAAPEAGEDRGTAADVTQGEESGTVTFTDALERSVTVRKSVERVAALLGSFADIWMLSGGSLCAAADDAWEDFGLELGDAVNLGGAHSPSLELLLASDPEFVIASASTKSNVEMREALEAAGITVAYFDVDNFYDYLDMLAVCTDITGRKDLYEQNGLTLQTRIEQIKAQYQGAELPDAQRTVLLIRAAASVIKVKGSSGTILGEMLADMGCINIADSDESLLENLSVEAVIRQNPRHIFVVTMGSDIEGAKAALDRMIGENPAWSQLDAIREGRFYLMEKTLFNLKPNDRWAQAYETLYEILTKKQ